MIKRKGKYRNTDMKMGIKIEESSY
jgi:hypothetical protein